MIPARSSLEETSLGELLPGSILSDNLKPKIFTKSERPVLPWDGGGMFKNISVTELRNTVRSASGHNSSSY